MPRPKMGSGRWMRWHELYGDDKEPRDENDQTYTMRQADALALRAWPEAPEWPWWDAPQSQWWPGVEFYVVGHEVHMVRKAEPVVPFVWESRCGVPS